MANEGDEKTLAEAEKKLLEKVSSKPKLAPPVKKPDGDSALTSKDVENIVARKLDKFEKKQADFASSVEKKHDKFQEVLNKMSENIVKLVEPSNEAEVQTANGSKELSPSGLQDVNDEDELIEDDCSDEDEEDSSFVESLQAFKIARRIKPAPLVVDAWAKSRKVTEEYQEEDWKKASEDSTIKNYTMHPAANSFRAPEADSECPVLFQDKKDLEKKLVLLQNMAGASGHLTAEVLVSCDAEIKNLSEVIKEYRDPEFVIDNPREDAWKQ